jgi:hypothetical protein
MKGYMTRDELVGRTIARALYPNAVWEEHPKEFQDEMLHAARRAIHVLTLQTALPSHEQLLRAMWEDVSKDPNNLCVVLPRKLFDHIAAKHIDLDLLTQIHVPQMFAEELQLEQERETRPKGIVRRWLERLS